MDVVKLIFGPVFFGFNTGFVMVEVGLVGGVNYVRREIPLRRPA